MSIKTSIEQKEALARSIALTALDESHPDFERAYYRLIDRHLLVEKMADHKPFTRIYNEISMEILHAEADLAQWGLV